MNDEEFFNEQKEFIHKLEIVADFCYEAGKKQYGDIIVEAMQTLMRCYDSGKYPSKYHF